MKLSKNQTLDVKLRDTVSSDLPLIYELYSRGQNNPVSRIKDEPPVSYEEFKKFYDDKTIVRYTITSNEKFIGHTFIKSDNKITCELIPSKSNKGIGKIVLSKLMKLESRPFFIMGIRLGNSKAKNFAIENDFEEWYTVYRNVNNSSNN